MSFIVVHLGRDSPNSYQDFIRISLPVSTIAYLVLGRIFLIASKIGESRGSKQEYPAKSVGKQGEEFLIETLVKS